MYNKKGVSLIEVLTASTILAFVLTGVTLFLMMNSRLYANGLSKAEIQRSVNLITTVISADIRNSVQIDVKTTDNGNKREMEIENKDGTKVTWSCTKDENSTNYTLKRGSQTFNIPGVVCSFDCVFTDVNKDENKDDLIVARLGLKLSVKKANSDEYLALSSDYLDYYYYCRNKNVLKN